MFTAPGAARSPGCCRLRWPSSSPCCGLRSRAPRTDRTRAAALLWGGGLILTRRSSASRRASSTSTTRSRWRRRSAPWWASAPPSCGRGARKSAGASLWLPSSPARPSGHSCCSTARPSGCRGCATPCWSAAAAVAAPLIAADRLARRAALALAGAGIVFTLAGPAAYSLQTAGSAHSGALPSAGPAAAGGGFGRGGFGGRFARGDGGFGQGAGQGAGQNAFAGPGGAPPGSFGATGGAPGGQTGTGASATGAAPGGQTGTGAQAGSSGPTGNAGGLLDASRPSAALTALLEKNASRYTWVAATVGAQSAAGYQLATDMPVMSLGGFNGSDPYPTLAEFQKLVRSRQGPLLHRQRPGRPDEWPGRRRHQCPRRQPVVAGARGRLVPEQRGPSQSGQQQLDERNQLVGGGELRVTDGRRHHPLRSHHPNPLEQHSILTGSLPWRLLLSSAH